MPAKLDLTGKRFGQLVAVQESVKRYKTGAVQWDCLCNCGKTVRIPAGLFNYGTTRSCGCSRHKDMTGKRFGWLTVIGRAKVRKFSRGVTWECQCNCGQITYAEGCHLRRGDTKSCGCLKEARDFTRGTCIDPAMVPAEMVNFMKARRTLKKAIKQAS